MAKMKNKDIEEHNLVMLAEEYPSLDAKIVKEILTDKKWKVSSYVILDSLMRSIAMEIPLPKELASLFFTLSVGGYVAYILMDSAGKEGEAPVKELLEFMTKRWEDIFKLGKRIQEDNMKVKKSNVLDIVDELDSPSGKKEVTH